MINLTFPKCSLPFRPMLLSCLLVAAGAGAATVDFFVAPDGNDDHAGTAKAPFASLMRARDAVRDLLRHDSQQSIRVHVRGGTYRLSTPLRFTAADTPAPSHHLTLQAEGDEPVIVSGGRVIEGWEATPEGMWRVRIPMVQAGAWRFRELFLNDRRLTRARHPNQGYLRVEEVGRDRRTNFTFKEGDLVPVRDVERVELVFLHDWSTSRIPVQSIDPQTRTLTTAYPVGPGASHYAMDHFEEHPRYFLENSREYLDHPGEWHIDERRGELLYLPREGESLETSEFVAPVLTRLVEVTGNADGNRPAHNVHFKGIDFQHCAWFPPDQGYAGGQAAYHERRSGPGGTLRDFVPPAVWFEMAQGCSLQDATLSHLGGSGLLFGARCHSNRVEKVLFTDIAANGIMIGEDRGRSLRGRPWWQEAPEQAASGNVVRHSVIEHCGREYYGAVGIWVGLARGTRIHDNEMRHLPYTGVSLGWMWNPTPTPCRDNMVAGNHIHHVMQVLSDGGGIYTLGRQPGTRLQGNVIHDVPVNLGRAESNGMFLDEGTTGIVIADNVISNIVRSPLRFHRATTNLVTGNVLHVRQGIPPIRFNNTNPKDITETDNKIVRHP